MLGNSLNFFVSLQILGHFVASGLSIFNCNWYDIYDFTPDENTDAVHISLLKTTDSIDNHILTPQKALEHEVENSKLENGNIHSF